MITGKVREKSLSIDDIYYLTDGGYDIMRNYYGKELPRSCESPFRDDRRPSFGFFQKGAVWYWRDQATGEIGTAVQYVQKLYSLSFMEAKDRMIKEMGLVNNFVPKEHKKVYREVVSISVSLQPFNTGHKMFWGKVGITEEDCRRYDCYAVKECAIGRKRHYISPDERVFVYVADNRYKLYFPDRQKADRFRNNVNGDHMWWLDRYDKCDKLMIAKSCKDGIVLGKLGLCVTATQSESISCISPNVPLINSITPSPYICFGQDKQGWEESMKITTEYGWNHFNIPNKELDNDINDPFAYASVYGLNKLEELLKNKQILC